MAASIGYAWEDLVLLGDAPFGVKAGNLLIDWGFGAGVTMSGMVCCGTGNGVTWAWAAFKAVSVRCRS